MTFLHVQDEKPFLANRIWQMANRFGEGHINLANFTSHYMQSLMQNVGEIEQGIFLPKAVHRRLFAWRTKFSEIDPRSII